MSREPANENPFEPGHFARVDETDDRLFYTMPRLVRHIDDGACAALTGYFAQTLPAGGVILDLMSSYASHLPEGPPFQAVIGLGMNAAEMAANPQLTGAIIQDLNKAQRLPFADAVFDACVLSVSVQYLIEPVAVFNDVGRVLKPDAPLIVSFSNRCFPTKAVAIWRGLDDADHARLIALYLAQTARFAEPEFQDLSPPRGAGDPPLRNTGRPPSLTGDPS